MPRKRMYFRYEIPKSVVSIVRALCADYDRRDRAIKAADAHDAVLDTYKRINNIIDSALLDVENGVRSEMLKDIQFGRGYDFSQASVFMCRKSYYLCKRRIMYEVAAGLNLI